MKDTNKDTQNKIIPNESMSRDKKQAFAVGFIWIMLAILMVYIVKET